MIIREDETTVVDPDRLMARPRGFTITEDEARRWSDLFLVIMVEHGGLSVPDAAAVLQRQICERQIRNRLAAAAPVVKQVGVVGVMTQLCRRREERRVGRAG